MATQKTSPLKAAVVKEKIEKGQVKVKGTKSKVKGTKSKGAKKNKSTKTKEHSVTGNNGKITDKEVIDYLKIHNKPCTSTQIRDALGFKSRTQARRVLRRLAKVGKVNIGTCKISDKRQIFTFEAVA